MDVTERPTDETLFPGDYSPDFKVEVGGGVVGITIDDGCLVALTQDSLGYWFPTTHIPPIVALRLGELAATGWPSTDRYNSAGNGGECPPPPRDEPPYLSD